MAQKYRMPQSPLTGDLRPRTEWTNYLAGIEELGKRVAVNVPTLVGAQTNDELRDAFNALLTALQNANLQNTE
jgi:hypothetical protein